MFVTTWGSTPENSAAALAESQEIFTGTFGSSANLNPQSVNGQFIQQIANIILNNDSALQLLYNGILNPNIAPGAFLDSICSWLQLVRKPSTYSVVTCTCTGLSGVVIPANSQVMSTNGDLFTNLNSATIGVGGTVDVVFTAVSPGPVACNPSTVNSIVQTVSGWDTVNNSAGGTVGTDQQSDYSLRQTRIATLANNSTGLPLSLTSALSNSVDIEGFWILFNNTSAPQTFTTGIAPYSTTTTVAANSIFASIYGGSHSEIGAIFYSKLNGCGTDGSTAISYTDPTYSFVTMNYNYQVPTATRLEVDVILPGPSTSYPLGTVAAVQKAVYNNYYGLDGSTPVIMSTPIFTSRFQAAITTQLGIQNVQSITIGEYASALYSEFQLPITLFGTLAATDVVVTFTG